MEDNLIINNNYTFSNFEAISRKAAMSNFLGTRNENEVFTLLMLAQAEGKNPIQASMDYVIIQGRPALKSQAILVRFQKSGGKIEYLRRDDIECKIKFSHPQGGQLIVSWTMETAKQAGLNLNRDNWKKYPRQMLAARCIAEGVRALYPACLDGLYVAEEVQDFDKPSNIIQAGEVNINDTAYDIETNTYINEEPDYNIIPKGANKDRQWGELDIDVLAKAKIFYTEKEYNEQYIKAINEVLEGKISVCPIGECKGRKWIEMTAEELGKYYKDYKDGKLIGYAEEYASFIETILLEKQSDNKKNIKTENPNNIQVTEDEDPFSSANDDGWDALEEEQTKRDSQPPHQIDDGLDEEDSFNF